MVICLERGADLHIAQLMPLPLTVSCFSKMQIGFTFLVPAHLGSPRKGPLNVCVCVCVCCILHLAVLIAIFSLCMFMILLYSTNPAVSCQISLNSCLVLNSCQFSFYLTSVCTFSALVGRQEGHPACKKLSGYLSGAMCRLAYGPADATHCLLLQ